MGEVTWDFLIGFQKGQIRPQADPAIRTTWKAAHVSQTRDSSQFSEACLGMSDKGYHAGLNFTAPNGQEKTTWHRPLQRRDRAMAETYKAFHGWAKSHEAQMDRKQPRDIKRCPPSWER